MLHVKFSFVYGVHSLFMVFMHLTVFVRIPLSFKPTQPMLERFMVDSPQSRL